MADKRSSNEGAIHLTAYDNIFALQELMSHQLCRGSNLHKDNDGSANCRPGSADLLYTTLDRMGTIISDRFWAISGQVAS